LSTLRKDPVSDGWVIIAEERAARPMDFAPETPVRRTGGSCPFCEGHEHQTPPEIVAFRRAGSGPNMPGWSVRAIPNKFAALHIEGNLDRRGEGIYDLMNGIGAHEVIVETPDHDGHMVQYGREKVEEILRMYLVRCRDLFQDKRFRYIQIFRNYGPVAGASLAHPHSQLIALPISPRWVKEELHSSQAYWRLKERCLFCDIVRQELEDRSRVVFENSRYVSIEPFASKFPFETWLFPKEHEPDFAQTAEEEIGDLAEVLQQTLLAISRCLNDPPWNYLIHSAPRLTELDLRVGEATVEADYHWHIEIFPRLTRMAGFEWGTGFYINPMVPETAAAELRKVLEPREAREESCGASASTGSDI